MLSAEARVRTARASRYLVQVCKHLGNQGRHLAGLGTLHRGMAARHGGGGAAPRQALIESTDTDARIDFGFAQATMHASDAELTIKVQAPDRSGLQHVQELLTGHLERFSRRDQLSVDWQATPAPPAAPAGP